MDDAISLLPAGVDQVRLFKKLVKRTLGLLDFSKEVIAIQGDPGAAPAGELTVCLQPSDRLRRISAAILTRDIDSLFVEHDALLAEMEKKRGSAGIGLRRE